MIQQLFSQLSGDWSKMISGHTPAPTLDFTLGKLELSQRVRDLVSRPRAQGFLLTQEFKQGFQVTIGAPEWSTVEPWSAIFLALLLTDHEALIERFNQASAKAHGAGNFTCRTTLSQLTILEGIPAPDSEQPLLRLECQAIGRMELGKQNAPTFDVIKQVIIKGQSEAGATASELSEYHVP